ncbi:PepSY domain-containing protein [Devosia sp.]|uniref:PepSY domain-containing protein n=1 Tax=Devosia sp. TaxID=1871048 RepID=UPI003264001B
MLRRLHSLPGLFAGLIIAFMAITGVVLSLQPVLDHARAPAAVGISVADLAQAVSSNLVGVERIVHSASGAVTAYYDAGQGAAAASIDPASGAVLGDYVPSAFFAFFTELHRSMFLGMNGRLAAGLCALAMVVLSVSGLMLLANRLGGWRKLLASAKGTWSHRLHVELARLAIVGLIVSGLTGAVMSLNSFGLIGDTSGTLAGFPSAVDGGTPAAIASLAALQDLRLGDLRELIFPYSGDPTDVFTLVTSSGQGYVDQASGALLAFTPNSLGQSVYEAIYMLHTGQGLWWFGALLGMASLCVPALAVTGTLVWWMRRRNQPRIVGNVGARHADTVILVGSEGNSTWGFAATLQQQLALAGHKVHVAPMNGLAESYSSADQLLVLTATYGDGTAPASASQFLARLQHLQIQPGLRFAVLGFGDRSFANFCRFAEQVDAALRARAVPAMLPFASVDRQSAQSFAQWGQALGQQLGHALTLEHVPTLPATTDLVLLDRADFGMEVQAPTTVLRFALPDDRRNWLQRLMRIGHGLAFEPGDLVGIVPPGNPVPRYYSLASSTRDGVLEICVRKQAGGLCSEFLHGLEPGQTVSAFVKHNPGFRPQTGKAPVILIGAGTGIAPLAGFVRHNRRHRPYHLYFGGRDPASDFLYAPLLRAALVDRRLASLTTAFSRVVGGHYVQDRLRDDADAIRALVASGAQIMVCGGRQMADGVRASIDLCLAPTGETVSALKAKGRYLEDVY